MISEGDLLVLRVTKDGHSFGSAVSFRGCKTVDDVFEVSKSAIAAIVKCATTLGEQVGMSEQAVMCKLAEPLNTEMIEAKIVLKRGEG